MARKDDRHLLLLSQPFDFERLVELCRHTHEETRRSAARAVDRSLVVRNWLFGWYIVEYEQRGADSADTVFRIARFAWRGVWGFSARPPSAAVPARLVPLRHPAVVTDPEARRFYEIEAADNGWSVRELKRQLDSSLYERLALSRDKHEVRRLAREGQVVERASDLIKDPVVLEFLGLEETPAYSESDLEIAIIDRLQQFLLELGKGFLFEARQKRFSFDDSHFFVDLVFYNRLLRCYVLIDLKTGKLTHQDLGQMQMYVNYFDRYVKTDDELPTVGILLCDRTNDAVVKLTLPEDANIYASKYQLYLPSREELADQVAGVRREIEAWGGRGDG